MKRKNILILTHEPVTRQTGITAGDLFDVRVVSINDIMAHSGAMCGQKVDKLLVPEELKDPKMEFVYNLVQENVFPVLMEHGDNWRERVVYY